MNIDPKTGTIILNQGSLVISPEMKKDAFLASSQGASASLIVNNQEYATYAFRFNSDSVLYGVMITFELESLNSLSLGIVNEGETWSNWSAERELDRKRKHDHLLASFLGRPPYKFGWGKANSEIDPHNGSAVISIRFKNPE